MGLESPKPDSNFAHAGTKPDSNFAYGDELMRFRVKERPDRLWRNDITFCADCAMPKTILLTKQVNAMIGFYKSD